MLSLRKAIQERKLHSVQITERGYCISQIDGRRDVTTEQLLNELQSSKDEKYSFGDGKKKR